MSGFKLGDYVDVPTRLAMALKKYPDLRIAESRPQIVEVDAQKYVEISCTVWRDAEDLVPVVAYCWEQIPGKTPYTRGSEMMNASTSCLGRALGFLGLGIGKSIASRDEVEIAQARQAPAQLAAVVPMRNEMHEVPFPNEPQRDYATPKQLGMMRALANGQGLKGDDLKSFCSATVGREINTTGDLLKHDVSKVIDALKALPPK
jgi:hypothetical protein